MQDENKGFPLDAMLDAAGKEPEPRDDWEKDQAARRDRTADMLGAAIYAGDCSSAEAIASTIKKFFKVGEIMRGI